jgi:DNA modification methylase
MNIEHWSIEKLTPYDRNPRKNDHAVDHVASAIREYGFRVPIIVLSDGTIVDGHLRYKAARKLGMTELPVTLADDLTPQQIKALRISINRMADLAEWDTELLALEIEDLRLDGYDIDLTGFSADALDALMDGGESTEQEGLTDPDEVPEPPPEPISKTGDIWILGNHRLMCGDSTDAAMVARLMNGEKAQLIHADPPYGMGKEKDGVENDNLYADKLDAFQMAWWRVFRPHTEDNGSAYIWGNAPELWRLWYLGGLADSERLTMRNEITWDKKTAGAGGISHMGADGFRQYPNATERCLFFMLGEQGFNNNADNYWEGWEPIRGYLEGEMKRAGWTVKDLNRITGTNMGGHWVTKSQWSLITAEHYAKIQQAARDHDAFKRDHDAFKRDHDAFKRDHDALKRDFYATRAYFDNTHDNMTDVWEFKRVTGEDRHGHATPKPVDMIARCMKSSLPDGGLCAEPFSGSGTTIIAAEKTGRRCYAMELSPAYVDVAVKRWQEFTGLVATHAETGAPFG